MPSDPAFEARRAELRERLAAWEPPAGTDPAEATALRERLEGLLERYQPGPGQSVEDAVAGLQEEFDLRLENFTQQQELEALREAEQARSTVDPAFEDRRAELIQELGDWQPPEGMEPAEAEQLKADLEGILAGYEPRPGVTADEMIAELRDRYEARVEEYREEHPTTPPTMPDEQQPDGEAVPGHWERGRAGEPEYVWVAEDGTRSPTAPDGTTGAEGVDVRDHRGDGATVRDHRDDPTAPSGAGSAPGGVTVTTTDRTDGLLDIFDEVVGQPAPAPDPRVTTPPMPAPEPESPASPTEPQGGTPEPAPAPPTTPPASADDDVMGTDAADAAVDGPAPATPTPAPAAETPPAATDDVMGTEAADAAVDAATDTAPAPEPEFAAEVEPEPAPEPELTTEAEPEMPSMPEIDEPEQPAASDFADDVDAGADAATDDAADDPNDV